jgi:hypothetical protein
MRASCRKPTRESQVKYKANPAHMEWQQWLVLSVGEVLASGILGYSAFYARPTRTRHFWLVVAFGGAVASAYSFVCCVIQIVR